jgi:hypothetical protein
MSEFDVKRQPRETRRRGSPVRLQPRDTELLRGLARLRIAPTGDIAALCFAGVRRDTVASRLRSLFDAGYVDVTAPNRTAENLYSLGPRGRALLLEVGEEIQPVPRGGLAHHLGIVRTWVALASSSVPGVQLELARPDWELRAEFGDRGLSVVPDLFVVLSVGELQLALAVEIDLATEPVHLLREKVRAYDELRAVPGGPFGWRQFGLALVLGDGRRLGTVEPLLAREWDGLSLMWTIAEGPGGELRRLSDALAPPLTDSPYGKGRERVANAQAATGTPQRRRGLSDR